MARILILIGAHFCTAPRPQKEATALNAAGHDVLVAGCALNDELAMRDERLCADLGVHFRPLIDWRRAGLIAKIRLRAAKILYQRLGIATADLLGFSPGQVLRFAREYHADLTIVHSEATLWVGCQLLNEGRRVGVDLEDWFSEDLPPAARAQRPIDLLRSLEKELLDRCHYALTTSCVLADTLANSYGVKAPLAIRNVFPAADLARIDGERRDRAHVSGPTLHWYSQTIGPGRGLESLFAALKKLKQPPTTILRGGLPPHYARWLATETNGLPADTVRAVPTVPNGELLSRISEHDIGLALETDSILSRDLTITNKFFQYLQGGLALIATETSGQREAFTEAPDVGLLVRPDDANALATAIERLCEDSDLRERCQTSAREAAINRFAWEQEQCALVALAEQALSVTL